MTDFTLWKKRLAHQRRARIADIKTIVDDWMIWVYILVPTLVICTLLYRDVLMNPPAWFATLPPVFLLILLLLRGWLFSYRVFLSPADPLFLQAGPWNERRFVYYSLGWHGIKEGFISFILVFLFYPYLTHQLGYGITESLLFGMLAWILQMFLLNINWFFNQWGKWVFYTYKVVSFLMIPLFVFLLSFIHVENWLSFPVFLGAGIGLLLSYALIILQKKWDWPLLIENAAKSNQSISLILTIEPEQLKKRKYTRLSFLPFMQKSWSNKVDILSVSKEIAIKMFFRKSSQWRYGLILLSGGISAVMQIDIFIVKVLVFAGVLFLYFQLVSLSQMELERRMWHLLAPVDIKKWRKGKRKGIFVLMMLFSGLFIIGLSISAIILSFYPLQ